MVAHCTEVTCVLESLLAQSTIRRRPARADGLDDLNGVQVARSCFPAFLHDLGKCAAGFQVKAGESPAADIGYIRALRGLCADDLADRFMAAVDGPSLLAWGEAALQELPAATFAHHGRPVALEFNSIQNGPLRATRLARDGGDPLARVSQLAGAGRALFPAAFDAGPALPADTEFQHLFAGLSMLADWPGSRDADLMFPFSRPGDDRPVFAR